MQLEKQKSLILKGQKEETELLAKLKEEEIARIEIERRLIESQKEQIHKELLARVLQIEHKNDLISNLSEKIGKEKFDQKALQKLNSILREEQMIDNDFEKIKTELQTVHPHFFKKLQEKSSQKLTTLDLKYCAAIHIKLSTKQMALLFSVEPQSIRMSKYRLKQKLNISKEISLDDWISQIDQV